MQRASPSPLRARRTRKMPSPTLLKTDEQEVLAANQAFYEALEALDLEQMKAAWWQEDWVVCVHPGWDLIQGWEEIQESWVIIFYSTESMRVIVIHPLIHAVGEAAWVSCFEVVDSF